MFDFLLVVWLFLETHQGASRGHAGTALSPSWLQQGFHDRSLPAAACQAHPHGWGLCKMRISVPFLSLGGVFYWASPQWSLIFGITVNFIVNVKCTGRHHCWFFFFFFCFLEERNYICDQCGQTFKQRKHLSVHQMRHSGAKPLQ